MARHQQTVTFFSRPVLINCGSAFFLLLFVGLGGRLTEMLDVVSSPLLVTELLCVYLVVYSLTGCLIVKDTAMHMSSTKVKSIRLKASRWLSSLVTLAVSVPLAHIILVLFGAPIIETVSETFHFACLLVCASVLPCVCAVGPSVESWIKVWVSHTKSRDCASEYGTLLLALFSCTGAWLGAFPIPLDWDRPWQVWPVSCVVGTVFGHCAGLLAASACLLSDQRRKIRNKSV